MSRKATVVAPSNIALIKYWGTRDLAETLPFNPSFSMTLRECATRTTVEGIEGAGADNILVSVANGGFEAASESFAGGVIRHLDRLRAWADVDQRFRVATQNSFPMGAGLASSASGFAALALAVVESLEREVDPETASRSGTAEWLGIRRPIGHGRLCGMAGRRVRRGIRSASLRGRALGSARCGRHPGYDGEASFIPGRAQTGRDQPLFRPPTAQLPHRLAEVRQAIAERDFARLAPIVEEEAIDLHLIAMSSRPPIFYWQPASLAVLQLARDLREDGVEVCSTMDAGANVHLLCTVAAEGRVVAALRGMPEVQDVIRDGVGDGPQVEDQHLF